MGVGVGEGRREKEGSGEGTDNLFVLLSSESQSSGLLYPRTLLVLLPQLDYG